MIRKVARIVAPGLLFSPSLCRLCVISLSTCYIYYKYYKIFLWKKFSQENVFATLWPILEIASY